MNPTLKTLFLLHLAGCALPRATLPGPPMAPGRGPVLFVLSSAREQTLANGRTRATGLFLGEFFEAYRAVTERGFEVVFATAEGRSPAIDPESLKPAYWKAHPEWQTLAQRFTETNEAFQRPVELAAALADESRFIGLVVPGGQGVMVDLLDDQVLHELLLRFGRSGRPVGLICHAPALLTRLGKGGPFRGRAVTSVSGLEEFFIETFIMGGQARERSIARQLEQTGLAHSTAFPGASHAVRDGSLVTSQNPASGAAFSAHYLAALEEPLAPRQDGAR